MVKERRERNLGSFPALGLIQTTPHFPPHPEDPLRGFLSDPQLGDGSVGVGFGGIGGCVGFSSAGASVTFFSFFANAMAGIVWRVMMTEKVQ
mgnify:CR=1 FL=1